MEGLLERDFFGQEAANMRPTCAQEGRTAKGNGAGEDYGGVWKDLDKDFGVLAAESSTLVPDGAADRRRPTRANHRQTTLVARPRP